MQLLATDHMSMIDDFTEGFAAPTHLSDGERCASLCEHVVNRFAEINIGRKKAIDAFYCWLKEIRAAQRLCETPGKEPELERGERAPYHKIDGRTNVVLSAVSV